jgi:hypothetical protein
MVRLNAQPIKGSLHELLAKSNVPKTPKFDNVACIPTPDPQEVTVFDEEWFKRRCKPKEGYQEWKF